MKRFFCTTSALTVLILAWCFQAPISSAQKPAVPGYPNVADNAIEHNRQGTNLMKLERYQEAAEHFQAAIMLNPYSAMSAAVYNNLGIAYQHLNQYPLAIASFHHALRIQPDFSIYYQNLIDTYRTSQALPSAQSELQGIVEFNPDNAEAFYLLGLIYKEQGTPELADYCFTQFSKIKPYSPLSQHTNAIK